MKPGEKVNPNPDPDKKQPEKKEIQDPPKKKTEQEIKEELKKEYGADVPDSVLDKILQLSKDAEHYKGEAHRTAEQREALKKKIADAEEEERKQQGKFEELYTELKTKFDEQKKELDSFKSKYTSLEEKQREDLLKSLPDGEAKNFAESLDLDRLRDYVKVFKATQKTGDAPPDGGSKFKKKPDGKRYKNLSEWRKNAGI
jgi:chromosome segregation ATPase